MPLNDSPNDTPTTPNEKLQECPFCGENPELCDGEIVQCPSCGVQIYLIERWNTRPTPSPDASLVESVLPQRDKTIPAEQQGVFRKFNVMRVDESDKPGGKHHGCEYFVLDTDHDPHAKAALIAYAQSCALSHPQLSKDMLKRYALTAHKEKHK